MPRVPPLAGLVARAGVRPQPEAGASESRRTAYQTDQAISASIALHERAGFRIVGRRERIAELDGVWRDTLFLELRLGT